MSYVLVVVYSDDSDRIQFYGGSRELTEHTARWTTSRAAIQRRDYLTSTWAGACRYIVADEENALVRWVNDGYADGGSGHTYAELWERFPRLCRNLHLRHPDDDDYVNEDCPDHCDVEHDVEMEEYNTFTCPATRVRFVYCSSCGGWESFSMWYSPRRSPDDDGYLCPSCADETIWCGRCDANVWLDGAHYVGNESEDYNYLCESCYEDHEERHAPVALSVCATCHSTNDHLDDLTEDFICDHVAREKLGRREPVTLARPLPELAVAA